MKTLWCKNQENPSDRISHAWAPLTISYSVGALQHMCKDSTTEAEGVREETRLGGTFCGACTAARYLQLNS
jgi:hypothetical protein